MFSILRSRLLPFLTLCNLYLLHPSNASPTPATLQNRNANVHVHVPRNAVPAPVQSIVDTLLVGNGSAHPELESQLRESAKAQVTVLSDAEVASFTPFTHYASTAYCDPSTTATWTCGANCDANPGFQPIASGGNGGTEQFWYVGYDATLDTVIVAHQGTDTSMLAAVATDAFFVFSPLRDATLFPNVDLDILVHTGFKLAHARVAAEILSAVETALQQFSTTHVTVVGHSLGAALALLEMVYLPLHLPSTTTFDMYGYGMPRVGNKAFANYVDANAKGVRRVNNKRDIVPVIPLRLMAFRHPSGEKHILDSGEWVACSGQENTANDCTLGYVPTIFNGDANDHSGPYAGITMGCD